MSHLLNTFVFVFTTIVAYSRCSFLDGKMAMMLSVTNAPDYFGIEKESKGKVESLEFVADDYQDIFTTPADTGKVTAEEEESAPIASVEIVQARQQAEPVITLEGKYKDLFNYYRNPIPEQHPSTTASTTTSSSTTTVNPVLEALKERFPGRSFY